MRHEVKQTITDLSNLDLATYPYNQTIKLIGQLGKFGCILVTLHQGKTIMRARPNYNDERFSFSGESPNGDSSVSEQSINSFYNWLRESENSNAQQGSFTMKLYRSNRRVPVGRLAGEGNVRENQSLRRLRLLKDKTGFCSMASGVTGSILNSMRVMAAYSTKINCRLVRTQVISPLDDIRLE